MTVFARQLSVAARREALVAEDGMKLLPDRIVDRARAKRI